MEYGLHFMSEKGKYTKVQIVLPCKKQLDLQENCKYE